ncbi:MAG: hypothetical protein LBI99_08845, partial [Propionibacteriaceae bacterium]|nr:hypothetical protein [Propionibacteriaceae bacterium]
MNQLIKRSLLALGAVAAMFAGATPAAAIPPSGPGADTPGTSSSVSPKTLKPCQTLSFKLAGFPGGETVYVKIDDGVGFGNTSVQGSGVWYAQAIPASGKVSGSFALPCDIAPGSHWLRFLASEYVDPKDPGKGVIGYTRRGGTDFKVVAGTGANPATNSGAKAPAPGQVVGSGENQVAGAGGVVTVAPATAADPSPAVSAPASAEPTPSAQPIVQPTVEPVAIEPISIE